MDMPQGKEKRILADYVMRSSPRATCSRLGSQRPDRHVLTTAFTEDSAEARGEKKIREKKTLFYDMPKLLRIFLFHFCSLK